MAAAVLKGRKVAPGVRLLIAPASVARPARPPRDGTLAPCWTAGAILLPTGCGACAGYGAGVLGEARSASPRPTAISRAAWARKPQVYLGSPYTVAASRRRGPHRRPAAATCKATHERTMQRPRLDVRRQHRHRRRWPRAPT